MKHLTLLASCLVALAQFTSVSAASAAAPGHSTLILLVDASGSMRQSDPGCLRADAAELLLSLLPDGDRIAAAQFGTSVRPMATGVQQLSAATRRQMVAGLRGCAAGDLRTDIVAALAYANGLVQSMPAGDRAAFPPHVLLLTDGQHDPPPESAGSQTIADALRSLKSGGVQVHGLGLGPRADRDLIGSFMTLTGGQSVYAASANELISGFLTVAQLLGRRWLLVDEPLQPGSQDLSLPQWISEWRAIYLPSKPGGRAGADSAPVLEGPAYQVFQGSGTGSRVRLSLGVPGRVIVDGAGDLNMRANLPAVVPTGLYFPCTANLTPATGETLGHALFLDRASVSISMGSTAETATALYDDGRHEDRQPGDGWWGGRCVVDRPGRVLWRATFSAPVLDPPFAAGSLESTDRPLELEQSSYFGGSLRSSVARPVWLRLKNRTGVPIVGRLVVGSVRQAAAVPADSEAEFDVAIFSPALASFFQDAWFETEGTGLRYPLGEVATRGRLALPGAGLVLLAVVLATLVFPRRTSAGSIISVRGQPVETGEPFSAVGRIGGDGRPEFRDAIPGLFARPGSFTATSGMWRRAVLYSPEPWLSPQFPGKRPPLRKSGFELSRTATWTCTHEGYRVTYTFSWRG